MKNPGAVSRIMIYVIRYKIKTMFLFFDTWECRTQQRVEPNKNNKKKAIKTRETRNFNRNKKNSKRKNRNTKNRNTKRNTKSSKQNTSNKSDNNRRIERVETRTAEIERT